MANWFGNRNALKRGLQTEFRLTETMWFAAEKNFISSTLPPAKKNMKYRFRKVALAWQL
jgi:hypothetical protein